MKHFPPFCLFGESRPHKTSEFIYDRQPVLFVSSFLFFISIDVWESCHTSYFQPKLPVELTVNKALSACQVCPRLTHLFPAGHFVTSSTLSQIRESLHVLCLLTWTVHRSRFESNVYWTVHHCNS